MTDNDLYVSKRTWHPGIMLYHISLPSASHNIISYFLFEVRLKSLGLGYLLPAISCNTTGPRPEFQITNQSLVQSLWVNSNVASGSNTRSQVYPVNTNMLNARFGVAIYSFGYMANLKHLNRQDDKTTGQH